MKIADISVSRCHSYLRIRDKKLFIEDNNSKFGTLVKINKPMEIIGLDKNINRSILLQIDRSLV